MRFKDIPKAAWIWIGAVLVYLVFLFWHGALRSPLSQEEVEDYVRRFRVLYKDASEERVKTVRALLSKDDGKPIYMFNAIKLYEKPLKVAGVEDGMTSLQVLSKYDTFVMSYLLRRGGHPVLAGKATHESVEHWGMEKGMKWDIGAVVRYPNRRILAEMIVHPEFQRLHKYKRASIEKTFAFPTEPIFLLGVRLVFGLLVFGLASFAHLVLCLLRLRKMTAKA